MNRTAFIILILFLLLQGAAFAATAESTSYRLTLIIADAGGGTTESSSYVMLGKIRDYAPNYPSVPISLSYRLNEGFLRSIFYGPILGPFLTSVSPNYGYNDGSVFVTISGGNFRQTGTTTVELRLTGETTIVATGVSVPNTSTITCTLDLSGARPDFWTLYVNNDGYENSLVGAFEVKPAPLKIIGPVYNYPNPFNPDDGPTIIKYKLTQDASITVNLYNIRGERIYSKKYYAGSEGGKQGDNAVEWFGRNVFDAVVPNGVYVCQIVGGGKTLAIVRIAVLR